MKLKTKLVIVFMVVMVFPMLFTGVMTRAFVPEKATEIQQMYLIVVSITAALLIIWIYRAVSVPLQKLQKAARNIKEGNLDFEIKAENDDEIGQLCRDFEEMRLRLKVQAEEKVAFDRENKELISNISHDLKTPITAIKGYVEGIMDGVADTPEKMDRYIRTIYNKANEMNLLINELTLYSKIDTNRIPYNFTTISAKGYFGDCAEDLSVELESKGAEFTYRNFMDDDCKVIVDPEQLRRVINNIVSNSLKYTDKPKVEITMDVKDVGDFIQIDPGTVHAIKGGLLILETQQNSDITYRVYDYDRLQNGRPRELHIEKSIDVITVPAKSVEDSVTSALGLPENRLNELYACGYYQIYKLDVNGTCSFAQNHPFLLMSVLEGSGIVNGQPVKKGDHFILPCGFGEVEMQGEMSLVVSTVPA